MKAYSWTEITALMLLRQGHELEVWAPTFRQVVRFKMAGFITFRTGGCSAGRSLFGDAVK